MDNQIKIRKKTAVRFLISLCLISALIFTMSPAVLAAAAFDDNTPCSLTLDCSSSGNAVGEMVFHLYRVADGTNVTGFTLSGDFAEYRVNLKNLDDSGLSATAYTLAAYTAPDDIQPIESATADSSHVVDFNKLSDGLYLVVGESVKIDGKTYTAVPTLVSLPNRQGNGSLAYDLKTKPKISVQSTLDADSKVDVSVVKTWNDGGHTEMRPASIEINLLCNGKLYERRNLTAADYWRHTWTGLSGDCNWTVIERNVSEKYDVLYAAKNTAGKTTLTVTNTSTVQTSTVPDASDGDAKNSINSEKQITAKALPQTGLLWWPVSLMAVSGIVIFGFGWRRYFNQDKENDEE
ncbi:Cna B-type domain-containing protein [Acetobacterium paludosum]|nr:Cna B-type domain-containing protein [Acetobacterium paludosum]